MPLTYSQIARRIRVPLGFLFAGIYLWLARPTWRSLAFGALIIIPGLLLRALAAGHVRKNAELTTTGPYAYTRNPLYLGSMAIAAGFAVAAKSPWIAGLLVILFAAIYVPVIRSEEAFLRDTFPGFADYRARVPRLLPRLTAGTGAGEGGFAAALYAKHREYNALLGALAMMGALIAKILILPGS